MAVRSFQARLLSLLIAVLVLLDAGTLVSVYLAGQRTLRRTVAEELRVGARVLNRILDTRAHQLAESTAVTALDFPFRDAVASADMATVTSVLQNHGRRVKTDAVLLINLNGIVTTDTLNGRLTGKPFPFPALLHDAEDRGEGAAGTVSFLGRPYQFVIVPVRGPQPIAWVGAGFEIDDAVLQDVERLTSLDVSLPRPNAAQLMMNDPDYASLPQHLQTRDGSRVEVLLRRSLAEARKPFVTLQLQIVALSSLILLAAVFAAVIFARSVSRPLQVLAEGAGRIGRGDYVEPIVIEQQDEIGQLAVAFNQMQSAIAAREDQIKHQSTHDALTGLPNRTLFFDRVTQSIAVSKRTGGSVGMIMMDVDRFKEINDTLGHHFGDQLLIEIGRRLEHTSRASDTVARLGGDEFAIKFTVPSVERAMELAERVGTAFDAPFVLGDVAIDVDASLGIALYPAHADDADTLMKRADIAMYEAKKSLSGVAMYEAGRDEHSLRRLSLMMELKQAILRDELELHFQPKIDVRSEHVVHVEALVRWKHAVHGIMRPDEFIPLAEQSGNIGLITKWVLRKAIAQCAAWNGMGLHLTVAVNLSALDLFDSELPTFISGLLSEARLPPTRLVLEITESAVMEDTAYALKILSDLKSRGIGLAIDDFGTGYSSLGHLKRLPVDELKIDKSFVLNLTESSTDDLMIVRSTIELGHNMGLVVIAEGVETQESWGILKRLGCDMAQGYFMSPPLPAAKLQEWFVTSKWGSAA
ncbi:MAG TPA: EAL domain-containing protein [Thermoanaerobaculia bacterium]|jgi:diguanylate cyclase (GGDEF)-like protein|nr:EAL domain-containing protein [Thermoanaerobaculia bacterium]